MASRQNGELMQLILSEGECTNIFVWKSSSGWVQHEENGKMSGMRGNFTLPELEYKLEKLVEGALFAISARNYKRLFGVNDAAVGRLRHFA